MECVPIALVRAAWSRGFAIRGPLPDRPARTNARLPALLVAMVTCVASAACSREVHGASSFSELLTALEGRNAILVVREDSGASIVQAHDAERKTIARFPLVERRRDIVGSYWDAPLTALSFGRDTLFVETNRSLPVGRREDLYAREVDALELANGAVTKLPDASGSYYILRLVGSQSAISPDGRTVASAGVRSPKEPAKARVELLLADVVNLESLGRWLGTSGANPPIGSRLFTEAIANERTIKRVVSLKQWAHVKVDRYVDIHHVSWVPDGSGLYWLEMHSRGDGNRVSAIDQEIWYYDRANESGKRIATLAPDNFPATHLGNPLRAVSRRHLVFVARTTAGKSVTYTNYLIDSQAGSVERINDCPGEVVGVR